jgi:hypothetical protein
MIKYTTAIAATLFAGCMEYPPCPYGHAETQVIGPSPAPQPGTGEPGGDNFGAYKQDADGQVCECGIYDSGCWPTPEDAERYGSKRPFIAGEHCSEAADDGSGAVLCAKPPTAAGDTTHEASALFSCMYEVINRRTGRVEVTKYRDQKAPDLVNAHARHVDWCTDMSSRRPDSYAYRPGPCSAK